MAVRYLDIRSATQLARTYATDEEADLLKEISDRKSEIQPEMDRFALMCDRFDTLYYPPDVLEHAGASHWAHHPTATTPGRSHVSINVPPVYVDVPASLQSVPPVENMVATIPTDEGRQSAALAERLYFAWKAEENLDLKSHQACVVKGLYGRTAAKVYWDSDEHRPIVRIIDQPRNLYLGWGTSDYTRLDWCLYTYTQSAQSVYEEWGLEVNEFTRDDGTIIPFVQPSGEYPTLTTMARNWLGQMGLEVEVYDYWYKRPVRTKPKGRAYKGVKHETWNCIFVGNVMVKNQRHPEYEGKMPYVPLFNTYVPGLPDGRPELYDIESILREKDERVTAGSQMMQRTIDGQLWQLTGPEAPDVVPSNAVPKPNKVTAPGAGNRVEKIEPWMPEFQLEQLLSRLDRELADISGLNDLLRGLAPAQVLSSSKAIVALVANYEARIRMKRDLFYQWRRDLWGLAANIWARKVTELKPVLSGVARLDLVAPSLTPRDDAETAVMATNLVTGRLWSQKRGMDHVGVDDPESESDIIRGESTDASIWPERVQVMAQLMAVLQNLGYAPSPQAQAQVQAQAQSLANFRRLLGGRQGVPSMNGGPGEQPRLGPEAQPSNTPEGQNLTGPQQPIQSQTLVQGGEASNRLVSSVPVGGPNG